MKTIIKNKLNVILIATIVFICSIIGFSVMANQNGKANAEQTVENPVLTIESNNVSYSDSIYILYAVSNEGFDRTANQIKMLFWEDLQEEYRMQLEREVMVQI